MDCCLTIFNFLHIFKTTFYENGPRIKCSFSGMKCNFGPLDIRSIGCVFQRSGWSSCVVLQHSVMKIICRITFTGGRQHSSTHTLDYNRLGSPISRENPFACPFVLPLIEVTDNLLWVHFISKAAAAEGRQAPEQFWNILMLANQKISSDIATTTGKR